MNNNISNLAILISVSLFALVYMIYINVSEQLTTRSYIVTTYMYIFFAFLLIVLVNEQHLIPDLRHGVKMMAIFILSLILIVALGMISPERQLLKHIIWFAFIWIIGIMMNPVINFAQSEKILNKVLFTVGAMFLVMTYFACTKPLDYFDSWAPYLMTGLIGIIVSRLMNIIFSDLDHPEGFFGRDWVISIITVILFNGFLLYDTQKILKQGVILDKICVGSDNLTCADYPVKSLDLILDLVNLFANTTSAYSRK